MRCYNCANWEKSSYMDATCYNMPRCLMNDVNRRIKYNEFKYEVGKKILFKGWQIKNYSQPSVNSLLMESSELKLTSF